MGRYHKVRDDGHGLDLARPRELDVVANAVRRLWRPLACVDTACWSGQDLTKRYLGSRNILGLQRLQVSSNKASEQRGTDIVRVPLCELVSIVLARLAPPWRIPIMRQ